MAYLISPINRLISYNAAVIIALFRMLNAIHSSQSTFKRRLIQFRHVFRSAKFYKLLESCFCNHYMRVQIDDVLSESSKVEKGISQGSFLGLLFFVLFIDDLPNDIVYFSSYLFADDLFSM